MKRTVTSTSSPCAADCVTLLQIVPVRIHGEDGLFRDVHALLDPGSQTSLCTSDVLTSLNITGVPSSLCLQNVEGSGVPQNSQRMKLTVSPRSDTNNHLLIEVPEAFSVPAINVNPPNITAQQKVQWKHISDLNIPDYKNVEVKLLLGANVLEAVIQEEARVGGPGQPVAVKTAFGWTLTGSIKGLIPGRHREVMFIRKGSADQELTSAVENWWTTESFGVKVNRHSLKSLEDARAEKIMEDTTRLVDGRYETGLLWRRDDIELPNNRAMAVKRLESLEKGLMRQPDKARQYQKIIQGYLDLGFARKLTCDELSEYSPRRWFLPHHGVSNPNKPGKLRLVFDAAASCGGKSLNSELLSGPDMLLSLPGVLLRFREGSIALVGDVEQMYHQVRVIGEDQASLSFLWRDLKQDKQPETYSMLVTIFGAKCSPASANYVLRRTASDHEAESDGSRRAADAVRRNFYMDDFLKAEHSIEDAKNVRREVTALVAKGGFRLTKWKSNAEAVLLDIPVEERASGGSLRTENVLGCPWDPVTDSLNVRSFDAGTVCTKRGVVRAVARLFDPLGIVAPYALQAKLLVQMLWAKGYGWDEELGGSELRRWMDWVCELCHLKSLAVPRCLGESTHAKDRHHEMHVFCDASEAAFGAVAYMRVTKGNHSDVTFIMAKTRVAPLRQISIVRLELQGAVMASRMAAAICEELTYTIRRVVFWTDSNVVLQYLNNESRRFHTFVANRVAEIREASEAEQWHYVQGKQNPADVCSRGLSVTELKNEPGWLGGPEFLKYNEDRWPHQGESSVLSETDPEVRASYATATESQAESSLPKPERFSSWLKLKRVVAWMVRFVRNLASRVQPQHYSPASGPLSASELDRAETIILQDVQSQHFSEEIRALKSGETTGKSNRLQHVTPFLDSEGVLRVSGRLGNAPLAYTSKYPAIIPADGQVSRLVILDAHQQVFHSGVERTLTEVRSRFWLCRGRSQVKSVIRECPGCKRRRCIPQVPLMADLPCARLDDARAFSTVGVDYFGPMLVKRFRKTEKRYGVLFTCLASRAVHLELAQSMDTDSFLLALRRFISRRGRPKALYSDNGSNFVGAERQLVESLREWNQTRIVDELSQKGIEWHFIPPGAPHMGGVWERLVGSVKRAMRMVVGENILTDEVLHTLLTEVESMLNGRPLTYVSSDGRDPEPLTPNHLLLGCANANLSPGRFHDREVNSRKRWRQAQTLAEQFWKRWRREYLSSILSRPKWQNEKRNLQVGDVVLMMEDGAPRGFWPLSRVTRVFPGDDGRVRSVEVKTASGTIYHRPTAKVCLLEEACN